MKSPIDTIRNRVEKAYEDSKQADGNNPQPIDMMFQEFLTVLEEIEVYEEELTEQNNELEVQRYEVEKQRKRYEDLFEFAPEAYLVTDPHGNIREANQIASELLNLNPKRLIGKPMITFIEENNRKRFRLILSTFHKVADFDIHVRPNNGEPFEAAVRMAVIYDERGAPFEIRWVMRDVTESKRLQAVLLKSEERLMRIFSGAPIAIILLDKQGVIQESNHAVLDLLHYRPKEIAQQPVERLIYAEDWPVFQEQLDNLLAKRDENLRFEVRFSDWNDRVHWMQVSLSHLDRLKDESSRILMMTDDITAEKQIEQERVELRQRVMEGIENERVRLAQDLHDHPLQDLYGALFELVEVAGEQSQSESREKLEHVQETMQDTINSLRATCGELRPPSLRFYGLEKAIRYYIELIKPRMPDMEFQLELEKDDNRLSPSLSLALYRIVQQGLMNVMRHAKATKTTVTMRFHDDILTMIIEDNGVGFELPEKMVEMVREGHYGLVSMRDRVESIGGKMHIDSHLNRGTTLTIDLPVDANTH